MQETTAYTTGPLNQYTAIERGEEAAFEPVHDADGNQTLIRTSTGIWQVAYNAENRPVRFVNESAKTVVECTYDYMGRRHTRKVSVNGTVSSYLRYMYRGYLQIAAIDAVSGAFRWFLFWDPTQPEVTRPLAIRKDGTWYAYGWDLTGNVTEIFGKAGYLRTVYTYTPYGEATAEGGTSPSPSSGAANTTMKNWGWSTTTTGISIRTTEGGSAAIPSRNKEVGIYIGVLEINPIISTIN